MFLLTGRCISYSSANAFLAHSVFAFLTPKSEKKSSNKTGGNDYNNFSNCTVVRERLCIT